MPIGDERLADAAKCFQRVDGEDTPNMSGEYKTLEVERSPLYAILQELSEAMNALADAAFLLAEIEVGQCGDTPDEIEPGEGK